jgi:hypothetical protein
MEEAFRQCPLRVKSDGLSVLLAAMSMASHRQISFSTLGDLFGICGTVRLPDGVSVPHERTCHEIVVRLCRALGRRYFVNCIAVRRERYGSVANRDRLRPAFHHHGRCAEARRKATQAGACSKHGFISPDIADCSNVIINLSCSIGSARFSIGEAWQTGEIRQQLQRWLRNKLQNRQCPLGWVQLLVGWLCNCTFLANVYRHTLLHKLLELHRHQIVRGLGHLESPVDL